MNEYLQKFRAQYPEYGDMSDTELATALHAKVYADMSYPEFTKAIGLQPEQPAEPRPESQSRSAAELRVAASGGPIRDFLHMAAEGATGGQADRLAGLFPGGQTRAQFQQRTDDLQMLAPGASMAAGGAGVAGLAGLGPAVNAIRAAGGAAARGGAAALRSPMARRVVGDWLPKGGLGYLLLDKLTGR